VDEFSFDRCRNEMLDYERQISRYRECLVSEHKQAVREFNDTVETFNRMASQ